MITRLSREQRTPQVLLDKTLRFTGPREFRHGLVGWNLSEPEPAVSVPLRREYAFGGTSQMLNPRHEEEPDAPAMAEVAAGYGYTPAGFGVVGRAWAPRLALAGTCDKTWEDTRWPGLRGFDTPTPPLSSVDLEKLMK